MRANVEPRFRSDPTAFFKVFHVSHRLRASLPARAENHRKNIEIEPQIDPKSNKIALRSPLRAISADKVGQRCSFMPQKTPKSATRAPQERPKSAQERAKSAPRAAQDLPRAHQERPKSGPRAPKSASRAPQERSTAPQEQPREAKRGSIAPQEQPREAKSSPKSSQERPGAIHKLY